MWPNPLRFKQREQRLTVRGGPLRLPFGEGRGNPPGLVVLVLGDDDRLPPRQAARRYAKPEREL